MGIPSIGKDSVDKDSIGKSRIEQDRKGECEGEPSARSVELMRKAQETMARIRNEKAGNPGETSRTE
jgi:hypothetical protein